MNLLYTFRVYLKLIRRKFSKNVNSFCKVCGREVHDFSVPDIVWENIDPHIKRGHTLCYDCFCDLCYEIGLPTSWRVVPQNGEDTMFIAKKEIESFLVSIDKVK